MKERPLEAQIKDARNKIDSRLADFFCYMKTVCEPEEQDRIKLLIQGYACSLDQIQIAKEWYDRRFKSND